MKNIYRALLLLMLIYFPDKVLAQAPKQILIDIAHGQKFWNDPKSTDGKDAGQIERVEYMTGEIVKTATSVNGKVNYVKGKMHPGQLATCDLLFIHMPSSKYDPDEIGAIKAYLQKGGSLFLVMDVDYWSTLEQTNVNDMVSSFGISFGNQIPDQQSGGYTKPGVLTDKKLKITYHGGRMVKGGTPFCFRNEAEEYPFGTFMQLRNGGKIVAMGDGMVSLYMTSWNNVNDYQCGEFMHDVFAWLLK